MLVVLKLCSYFIVKISKSWNATKKTIQSGLLSLWYLGRYSQAALPLVRTSGAGLKALNDRLNNNIIKKQQEGQPVMYWFTIGGTNFTRQNITTVHVWTLSSKTACFKVIVFVMSPKRMLLHISAHIYSSLALSRHTEVINSVSAQTAFFHRAAN